MGASRECQVVPGTTPTALLAGAGTTKVGIEHRGDALIDNAGRGMNYSACPMLL
jgi:hypothetical protein